jgi:molecular chaperone DnaK (HSP70)
VSQQLNNGRLPAAERASTQPLSADAEASVRQLIANGHDKTALKRAKAIHETLGATASEALLVEAYAARIQSLIRQNLAAEAHGMLDLVRRRHPSAATRLDELRNRALVRAGSLDEVVAPLNDPGLSAERHSAIERVVRQDVWDVATLAGCATLAQEHPLRKAASALNRAFVDVTSGPVDESALALPEVSHRSPLAPWTLLVRAIACFYRGEDEPCRQYLDAITPESAPARLVPAIQAALGRATGTPLIAAAGEQARRALGQRPEKAVITVPAYFSDAQRTATREAGALAGLDVVRILNEPTAASLAYGYGDGSRRTVLVYDLGGGTFDVSVVTVEGDITEVLASHGDNRLGGDDFDDLLVERLAEAFQEQHGIDLRQGHAAAHARLWWAAEEAKTKLSAEPYVTIREEALVVNGGTPLHLELEMSRDEYERLIRPLVDKTLDSVSKALGDSGKKPGDLDAILLAGGSTRTPLVSRLLVEHTGLEPRQDVHPDLCVALGAGVLASRLAGHEIERVLVDVSPYSFGVSYLGERGGFPYPHCYRPIIHRNTPLPLTRTERYSTSYPFQRDVDLQVYQGDDEDALHNVLVGDFRVSDLTATPEPNEILCRMRLDLDGVLEVTAIEKRTGASRHITIANAMRAKSAEEIAAGRKRIQELYESRGEMLEDGEEDGQEATAEIADGDGANADVDPVPAEGIGKAHELLARSRRLLGQMHEEDREEAIDLNEQIEAALTSGDCELNQALQALEELLFFVEGHEALPRKAE